MCQEFIYFGMTVTNPRHEQSEDKRNFGNACHCLVPKLMSPRHLSKIVKPSGNYIYRQDKAVLCIVTQCLYFVCTGLTLTVVCSLQH